MAKENISRNAAVFGYQESIQMLCCFEWVLRVFTMMPLRLLKF